MLCKFIALHSALLTRWPERFWRVAIEDLAFCAESGPCAEFHLSSVRRCLSAEPRMGKLQNICVATIRGGCQQQERYTWGTCSMPGVFLSTLLVSPSPHLEPCEESVKSPILQRRWLRSHSERVSGCAWVPKTTLRLDDLLGRLTGPSMWFIPAKGLKAKLAKECWGETRLCLLESSPRRVTPGVLTSSEL